ncbi:MAG: DUF1588 domain-containing protein [Bdellovibrionaceae bacterium]|nr:DUF1588 domain-containing protein [Pseudobdellovibrionaceae bacterium]
MKILISIFSIFICAQFARAQDMRELKIEEKLKKLSFVLRGKNPTAQEYADIAEKAKTTSADIVLQAKAAEYVNTTAFSIKFTNKTADLFRINQLAFNFGDILKFDSFNDDAVTNPSGKYKFDPATFHLFVREIFEQNQSWTELLNKKSYYVIFSQYDLDTPFDVIPFYAPLAPSIQKYTVYPVEKIISTDLETYDLNRYTAIKLNFPKNDKRLGGVLTTPSFMSRYVTTGVNKNRKRAAAIFRTFLCKDMVASIPVPKDGVDENKKLALLGEGQYTENDITTHTKMAQVHGQNIDCNQCHKQLDPMGNLFNYMPMTVSQNSASGGLHYYNEAGEFVRKDIDGIGQLGQVITSEKDYYSCQVKHFWKWIHGENSLLDPQKELALVEKFKSVNQKPKDFVRYLVSEKEFYSPKQYTEAQISTIGAFKTLKKCQSCHNQQVEDDEVQNLNWYEIIGDKKNQDRDDWIKRIASQLRKDKMPPREARKDFTDQELERLKKWISSGAPDFEGK